MARIEFIRPQPTEDGSDLDIGEPVDDEILDDPIAGDPPLQKQKVKFPTAFPGKKIGDKTDPRKNGIREF